MELFLELKYCKSLGTVTVGLNSDASVGRLKGPDRPYFSQQDRQFMLESCKYVDEVVVFEPLGREQIAGIAEIQMGRLRERLAERELDLQLSAEALEKLVAVGYDPVYGARPLKRAIQRWIENPLAQRILAGDFVSGATIQAKVEGDEFVFTV